LFDVNREARLVQPSDSYKVKVSILRRHPPCKYHPTRARHREQIAIPRGLGGVGGQGAVRRLGLALIGFPWPLFVGNAVTHAPRQSCQRAWLLPGPSDCTVYV